MPHKLIPCKLTKVEEAKRDELIAELTIQEKQLADAVEQFNATLANQQASIEATLDAYNTALREAREFATDMAQQTDDYIRHKSEAWQESERGQAAQAWHDEWEALTTFEDFEIDFPEPLDIESLNFTEELEGAPTEPERI